MVFPRQYMFYKDINYKQRDKAEAVDYEAAADRKRGKNWNY